MKKTMKRMITLLLVVIFFAAMVPAASAEDGMTISVKLPVKVLISGSVPPQAETFQIIMTADDPSYPMPAGATGGVSVLEVKGGESGTFPEMVYDHVGIYTYTVRQEHGSVVKARYDSTVYNMVVTITNSDDYSALVATVALHVKTSDKKPDNVLFENIYKYNPETGDNSNMALYAAYCAASAAAMGAALVLLKKKN